MEARYQTLTTIFEIVKNDLSPETYLVTPHEIILRSKVDWTSIQKDLELLSSEKLIAIKQLDKIVVTITPAGISKARSFKNNFVSPNFRFPEDDKLNTTAKPYLL